MANTMKIGYNCDVISYFGPEQPLKDLRLNGNYYFSTGADFNTGGEFVPGDENWGVNGLTDVSGNPSAMQQAQVWTGDGATATPVWVEGESWARVLLNTVERASVTQYHAMHEGTGLLRIKGAGSNQQPSYQVSTDGHYTFDLAAGNGGIFVDISSAPVSVEPNYVKNVKIVADADMATYLTQPFNDKMISMMNEAYNGAFRSHNWFYSNAGSLAPNDYKESYNMATSSWDNRINKYAPHGAVGGSIEYAVEICNITNRDFWYCCPHLATEDYMTSAATYIKDNLNTNLSCIVEYSNEYWNGGFEQCRYTRRQCVEAAVSADYWRGLDPSTPTQPNAQGNGGMVNGIASTGADTAAANRYGAEKARQLWEVFYTVFGTDAPTRIVRSLNSQANRIRTTTDQIYWSGISVDKAPSATVDAIGIAPYFGRGFGNHPIATYFYDNNVAAEVTIASGLYDVSASDGFTRVTAVRAHKTLANEVAAAKGSPVALYCYEGGQHYVGNLGNPPKGTVNGVANQILINPATGEQYPNSWQELLKDLYVSANGLPEMGVAYDEYFKMLQEEGVELFCNYRSIGGWSKFGSWGVVSSYEHLDENPYKYEALVTWVGVAAVSTFYQNNVGYRLDINS